MATQHYLDDLASIDARELNPDERLCATVDAIYREYLRERS